jgi:ATP-dependent DNA helicase PIF1
MRELASGVYNMLKGTRQHAIPVGGFIDRVSKNEEEIETNLSTVFQNMRGSNQYWYLRRSEVLCIVREYGSPTLIPHTQLCRVRQPHLSEEGERCE